MTTNKQLFLTLFATLTLLLTTACSDDDDDNGNKNDASVTDNDSAVTDNDSAVSNDTAMTNDTAPPAKTCQPDCEGDNANCEGVLGGRTMCADNGACVACKVDGDCTNMALPECVGGFCLPRLCTGDADCTAGPVNTGLCNTDIGQCSRCETDPQCETAGLGKKCLNNGCVPCGKDADCDGTLGCDTEAGTCNVCGEGAACAADTGKTGTCVGGQCIGCDDSTECGAAFGPTIFGPYLCK